MTFNRGAWDGDKPLVAPADTPIEFGSVVWTRSDDAPGDSPRAGGIVVSRRPNPDTGELVVTVLVKSNGGGGKIRIGTVEFDASRLDPQVMEPPNAPKMHRVAREIFQFLGQRKGGFVAGFDWWLLATALGLIEAGNELMGIRAA